MNLLLGKTVLITGASRGLGQILANRFWREGASLLLVGRREDRLAQVSESLDIRPIQSVRWLAVDIGQPNSARCIVDWARSETDNVDVLINNAAIQGPIGRLWENDWNSWVEAFNINMLGPTALSREIVGLMIKKGIRGRILNISGGGAAGPRPRFTSYACAKSALVRLTEILAAEASEFGITVNAIAPGAMNTEMLSEVLERGPMQAGEKEYCEAQKIVESGGADQERVAELCVLLASDRGSNLTGRLISAVWDPWEELETLATRLVGTDIYTLRRIVPGDRDKAWGNDR